MYLSLFGFESFILLGIVVKLGLGLKATEGIDKSLEGPGNSDRDPVCLADPQSLTHYICEN